MYTRDKFDKECTEMTDMLKLIYTSEAGKNKSVTFEQIPKEAFTKLFKIRMNIKQVDINNYTEETFKDLSIVYKYIDIVRENKRRLEELKEEINNDAIESDYTLEDCIREIELCKKFIVYYLEVTYCFIKEVADKTKIKEEPVRKKSIFDIFKKKRK